MRKGPKSLDHRWQGRGFAQLGKSWAHPWLTQGTQGGSAEAEGMWPPPPARGGRPGISAEVAEERKVKRELIPEHLLEAWEEGVGSRVRPREGADREPRPGAGEWTAHLQDGHSELL